jgi:hypothetical protein
VKRLARLTIWALFIGVAMIAVIAIVESYMQ